MPAPTKLIRLGKMLGVSLKPEEVIELTRLAKADGYPRVSKWLVKQIREKIIQAMPVEQGASNGTAGDPSIKVGIPRHETKTHPAEPIERGTVAGVAPSPETEVRQDPPPAPTAPHSLPLNLSWASLSVEERKAKAAEWGVKAPAGFGEWTPAQRLEWLDLHFPLGPVKEEDVGW